MQNKFLSLQISTHLVDPLNTAKRLAASGSGLEPSNGTPDSGFRSQDNLNDVGGDVQNRSKERSGQTSLKSCIYNALCDSSETESRSQSAETTTSSQANAPSRSNAIITPRMSFSPADSLDSNVTLVSENNFNIIISLQPIRFQTELKCTSFTVTVFASSRNIM